MRRCIRTILLSVMLFAVSTSSARACFFFPLFDPLNWCIGHQNPYATRRVIDDWLGYGYLRGQQNGSLGHYPGRPWGCYAPSYPRLFNPMPMAAPCINPLAIRQPFAPMPTAPLYSGPIYQQPTMPFMPQPWNAPAADCGCGMQPAMPFASPGFAQPQFPLTQLPMPSWQAAPWGANDCGCGPVAVQPQPMAVQVPVTTYRPVTVDRGGYQMVWVSRPVTQMVPQTSWQTRFVQQPMMPVQAPVYQPIPMMQSMPMESSCGDTPCAPSSTVIPSTSAPAPSLDTAWGTSPAYQHYTSTMPMPQSSAVYNPYAYSTVPVQSLPAGSVPPQMYGVSPYGYNAAHYGHAANFNQPAAAYSVPGYGDVWGDHEQPSIANSYPGMMPNGAAAMMPGGIHPPGQTAMVPVIQNSFQGTVPVRRTSLTMPFRSASHRKYPNSVW